MTDDEKQRVMDEEIIRLKVRAQVESTRSGGTFWRLLNSPFVLMIVSTLVIGAGISYFQKAAEQRENELSRQRANYQKQLEFIGAFYDNMESTVMRLVSIQGNKVSRACCKSRLSRSALTQEQFDREMADLLADGHRTFDQYNDHLKPNALFAQARFLLVDKNKKIDDALTAFDRKLTAFQESFREAHDCAKDAEYQERLRKKSDEFMADISNLVQLMSTEIREPSVSP